MVWGVWFGVYGLGCMVLGVWFRVQGLEFWFYGLGFFIAELTRQTRRETRGSETRNLSGMSKGSSSFAVD